MDPEINTYSLRKCRWHFLMNYIKIADTVPNNLYQDFFSHVLMKILCIIYFGVNFIWISIIWPYKIFSLARQLIFYMKFSCG